MTQLVMVHFSLWYIQAGVNILHYMQWASLSLLYSKSSCDIYSFWQESQGEGNVHSLRSDIYNIFSRPLPGIGHTPLAQCHLPLENKAHTSYVYADSFNHSSCVQFVQFVSTRYPSQPGRQRQNIQSKVSPNTLDITSNGIGIEHRPFDLEYNALSTRQRRPNCVSTFCHITCDICGASCARHDVKPSALDIQKILVDVYKLLSTCNELASYFCYIPTTNFLPLEMFSFLPTDKQIRAWYMTERPVTFCANGGFETFCFIAFDVCSVSLISYRWPAVCHLLIRMPVGEPCSFWSRLSVSV